MKTLHLKGLMEVTIPTSIILGTKMAILSCKDSCMSYYTCYLPQYVDVTWCHNVLYITPLFKVNPNAKNLTHHSWESKEKVQFLSIWLCHMGLKEKVGHPRGPRYSDWYVKLIITLHSNKHAHCKTLTQNSYSLLVYGFFCSF